MQAGEVLNSLWVWALGHFIKEIIIKLVPHALNAEFNLQNCIWKAIEKNTGDKNTFQKKSLLF